MQNKVSVGSVFSRVFGIYGGQASTLIPVAFALFLVVGILQGLLPGILGLIAALASVVASLFYTGMVVKLVEDVEDGRRDHTAGELMKSVTPVVGPLFIAGLIVGVGVAIGLLLLIVPGLILLTIWAVVGPVVVVERAGVTDALGRSRALVRGNGGSVFLVILVSFLITFVVSAVLGAIGAAIGGVVVRIIFSVLANTLTAPIAALVGAVLYFTLRGSGGIAEASDGVATATGPEVPGSTPPPPPPPPAASVGPQSPA